MFVKFFVMLIVEKIIEQGNLAIRLVKTRPNVLYYTKYPVKLRFLRKFWQFAIKINRKDGIEMKKTIALVLLLILAVGVFAACNQVQPTERKTRWGESETWTYNISLANFADPVTTSNGSYFRDFLAAGETNPFGDALDRIAPNALTGTYVVTIKQDIKNDTTTVSATQTMVASYDANLVDESAFDQSIIVEQNNETISLKSVQETKVTFQNGTQIPVSSHTKSNGFYIGKLNQSMSTYEISTEYKVEGKKVVAKVTQGDKTEEVALANTNVIDTNQVLMFVRSYDKTETGFQDAPQVMVFDPLTKSTKRLTMQYTAKQNVLVEHKFADASEVAEIATQMPRLDVMLDGMSFVSQVSLPDMSANGLDRISTNVPGVFFPMHTIYRFRSGFVSYELTNYLTDNMVKSMQVKAA